MNRHPLQVCVNDELVLDAGSWEEIEDSASGKTTRRVHPPRVTMWEQVLGYLESKASEDSSSALPRIGHEAVATVAVCLLVGLVPGCPGQPRELPLI